MASDRRGLRRTQPTAPKLPKGHPDPVREEIRMERGLPIGTSNPVDMRLPLDGSLVGRTSTGPALPGEHKLDLKKR